MFYLDNFKTPQPTIGREHHLDMHAGLQYDAKYKQYTSASTIKMIPDISQSHILIGQETVSGWGIKNDHTIEKHLDPKTTNVFYNGKNYQCKKSKTFIGFWNPSLVHPKETLMGKFFYIKIFQMSILLWTQIGPTWMQALGYWVWG
jgi:hypothetical protein